MKYIKMLGLAAVAAMALMAFAGSASATTLTNGSGGVLGVGATIEASLTGSATLEAGSTTLDTCTTGSIKGSITDAGGAGKAVKGSVKAEDLKWSNCTWPTTTTAGGELEISSSKTNEGTLVGRNFQVTINGVFGTSCVYGLGTGVTLGTVKGGTPATLTISASVPEISKLFACPDTATWTASYKVTDPTTLHIDA